MQLILQSQNIEDVAVVRCQGRIVAGAEADALRRELENLTRVRKKVVLQLADVVFIDSAGLGALVRLFGVLQNAGGGLKLCQLSPFVLQVLQATNLLGVFQTYSSENEAVEAFSERPRSAEETSQAPRNKIVCVDTSSDLLAYLNALLKRSGYEVFTTRYPSEAMILVRVTRPHVVIYGPGMRPNESEVEKFHQSVPNTQLLLLESDFSSAEAGQAGMDLVNRIRSLFTSSKS